MPSRNRSSSEDDFDEPSPQDRPRRGIRHLGTRRGGRRSARRIDEDEEENNTSDRSIEDEAPPPRSRNRSVYISKDASEAQGKNAKKTAGVRFDTKPRDDSDLGNEQPTSRFQRFRRKLAPILKRKGRKEKSSDDEVSDDDLSRDSRGRVDSADSADQYGYEEVLSSHQTRAGLQAVASGITSYQLPIVSDFPGVNTKLVSDFPGVKMPLVSDFPGVNLPGAGYKKPLVSDFPGVDASIASDFTVEKLSGTGPGTLTRKAAKSERARYSVYQGKGKSQVKKKYRVRPYHCFKEGLYMTEEDIYNDSLKPSESFTFIKSYLEPSSKSVLEKMVPEHIREVWGSPEEDGRIGSLRVELLGCVSLDRSKPDVVVYLVCGDAAFCSDVLTGYRSPMWPARSRRAAVFPIHHAYARLYVGVFDARVKSSKENDVFCGRVSVDIAALRPDTVYDVTFPLRKSTVIYDRRKRGVIRMRFSLHWFSERAAILSYFKRPKTLTVSYPMVEGQPTIPCADPKTFRNVAVTVYGPDLPGKYSREAFRATIRELNLYQINLRLLVQVTILDTMLYENKIISSYVFAAGMYCILTNSIRMIPPFFWGYLLMLYVENYRHYVESARYNLGYKPLTLPEIIKGLLFKVDLGNFEPLQMDKRAKRRKGQGRSPRITRSNSWDGSDNGEEDGEIERLDHREFPFSERDAYPKLGVEDALAPSRNKSQEPEGGRLHGRLSVYYSATPPTQSEAPVNTDDDEESEESVDRDAETILTASNLGDSLYGIDSDADEDEMENKDFSFQQEQSTSLITTGDTKRRIKLGPPQDNDVKGRKVPPQLMLKKIENNLHKFSLKVSVEMVHAATEVETAVPNAADGAVSPAAGSLTGEDQHAQVNASLKKRKAVYDEFDKLLGMQSSTINPVLRLASSFLGPLMRMLRVFVYLVRIAFHVSTWRDPFLSFWVLIVLCIICLILIVFPWRSFFLLVTVGCFGPQNIFVRKYLQKKAAEKAMESSEVEDIGDERPTEVLPEKSKSIVEFKEENPAALVEAPKKLNFFKRVLRPKKKGGRRMSELQSQAMGPESSNLDVDVHADRPAFRSELHGQSTSTKYQPRAVALPYSVVKKDRFFDWPPDPTVSRATPMQFGLIGIGKGANTPDSADKDDFGPVRRRRGIELRNDEDVSTASISGPLFGGVSAELEMFDNSETSYGYDK